MVVFVVADDSLTNLPHLARIEVLTREGWVTEEERRYVYIRRLLTWFLVYNQDDPCTQEIDLSSNQPNSSSSFVFCG